METDLDTADTGLDSGMQFGTYLLRQRLGVGGMASVWKAIDETGRTLVIKRNLSRALDTEVDLAFRREGVCCVIVIPRSHLATAR